MFAAPYLFVLLLSGLGRAEYPDHPPFIIMITSGFQDCPSAEVPELILREAYEKLNIKFAVIRIPGSRSLIEANMGNTDGELARTAGISKHYPQLIQVPTPIYKIDFMAFSKKKLKPLRSYKDLAQYRWLYELGAKRIELEAPFQGAVPVIGVERILMMINSDRGDLAVLDRTDGNIGIKRLGYSKIKGIGPPIESVWLYHYLHVRHSKLVPKLDAILKEMNRTGRIKAIRDEYLKNL